MLVEFHLLVLHRMFTFDLHQRLDAARLAGEVNGLLDPAHGPELMTTADDRLPHRLRRERASSVAPRRSSRFRIERERGGWLLGRTFSYADLSLFQMVAGLRYAFPRTMGRLEPKYPRAIALHDRVASRPRIAAYLASKRRIAFNEHGIFRHYPELDNQDRKTE